MIINCSNFNPTYEIASGTEATLYASTTCEVQNPTSSIVSVENGFTHGEIVGSTLILLIFLAIVSLGIMVLIRGLKIQTRL